MWLLKYFGLLAAGFFLGYLLCALLTIAKEPERRKPDETETQG